MAPSNAVIMKYQSSVMLTVWVTISGDIKGACAPGTPPPTSDTCLI